MKYLRRVFKCDELVRFLASSPDVAKDTNSILDHFGVEKTTKNKSRLYSLITNAKKKKLIKIPRPGFYQLTAATVRKVSKCAIKDVTGKYKDPSFMHQREDLSIDPNAPEPGWAKNTPG